MKGLPKVLFVDDQDEVLEDIKVQVSDVCDPYGATTSEEGLEIFEKEGLFDRAAELAPYFKDAIMSLRDHELIKDIRTIGLMSGVEVHDDGAPGRRGGKMQKDLFWNGAHVKFTGDVGIVAPMFIAERTHIDEIVDKFRKTLDQQIA